MPYHLFMLHQMERLVDDKLMWAFTIVMIVDLITGMIKPYYAKQTIKKTDSSIGIHGLLKHTVIYLIVVVAYPYLYTVGASAMATTFLIAWIYQYLISIVENWTEMGWWLPKPIMDFFENKLAKNQLDYDPSKYNFLKHKGGKK